MIDLFIITVTRPRPAKSRKHFSFLLHSEAIIPSNIILCCCCRKTGFLDGFSLTIFAGTLCTLCSARELSQVSNFSPKMYFREYLSIVEGSHVSHVSHVSIQIKLDSDSVCSTDSGQQDVTQPSQTAISVPAFHSPQSTVQCQ